MHKLYLKLKLATIAILACVAASLAFTPSASASVGVFAVGVSQVSAASMPLENAPSATSLLVQTYNQSANASEETQVEQLCLANSIVSEQLLAGENPEQSLIGYVIGVPNNSVRFRLLRAYPELTFRVFNTEEGRSGRSLSEAIADGNLYVWWCNNAEALAHSELGSPVLTLSRPIVQSVNMSSETLNDYFSQTTNLISLRPEEVERVAAMGTMRIGLPADSSPIISRNDSGEPIGLDNDFVNLIATKLNLQVEWQDCGGWDACVSALENRSIDALTFMSPTPSRLLFTEFTLPYWEVDWALMSLETRPIRIDDFDTARSITIAVMESYSILETAENAENITVLPVASPAAGLNAVLEGNADAYLDSLPLLMNRVRELNLTGAVVHIARDLPGDQVSVGVRSDWAAIVPILDRAILGITDTDIEAIEERWFDPEIFRGGLDRDSVLRWALVMAITVLIVLAAILAWLAHLRREIERRKLREAEIRHKAYHDELTGLPNRMHIIEKAERAIITHGQNQRKCALLFIDLDGFKAINDNEGHDAGDELLIAVSQRLQRTVRKNDTVARYGGDEFLILVTNLTHVEQAENIAHKVLNRVSMPYRLATGESRIGASIGVAVFPDHGSEYEDLLSAADDAMYTVKDSGKNGVVLADQKSTD
ncbi:hypothetical protein CWE08_09705 [Aliidiomarina iranensis]|uniref:GGDEF domain-containing protein n=1 Tax=Aliidiomarina iranensis TaxID=1434071 RepID=A0A432VTA8_9GAMM|nr:diguanylate cyclase [Aliidiomarina iranensis]RUO19691.1 hypothetical protein CWE08_09705 [Aliidiomarina iranensis]